MDDNDVGQRGGERDPSRTWGTDWKHFLLSSAPEPLARVLDDLPSVSGLQHIWHYTTTAGLIGIVGSDELWVSSLGQLNDPSEGLYGVEILAECWNSISNSIKSPLVRDLFDAALEGETGVSGLERLHVFSASRNPDSLPLWAQYGPAQGFAVGLRMNELRSLGVLNADQNRDPRWWPPRLQFAPVVYEPRHQKMLAYATLAVLFGIVPSETALVGNVPQEFAQKLSAASYARGYSAAYIEIVAYFFRLYVASVKNPAYAHEEEVRLLIDDGRASELSFRESNDRILSFLRLGVAEPEVIPIAEVRCGPMVPPETRPIVRSMLTGAGHVGSVVTTSGVPFRG